MSKFPLKVSPEDVFRRPAELEVQPLSSLSTRDLERLGDLRDHPDVYGVARRGDLLTAVSCDIALLLLSLERPARLPAFFMAQGEGTRRAEKLVLDGLLEVSGTDGRFFSGPEALDTDGIATALPEGALAQLSLHALRSVAIRRLDDLDQAAMGLYVFNRLPLSPWAVSRFADTSAHLGLRRGGALGRLLRSTWRSAKDVDGWLLWRRRLRRTDSTTDAIPCKLYLSPRPEAMADVFQVLAKELRQTEARAFKVGKGAAGALRPDKMVVYFDDPGALRDAADRLEPCLLDTPVQGVPFTAELGAAGLLSWGMDPPPNQIRDHEGKSWRWWIAHRLAAALMIANKRPSDRVPAWRFALERLRLERLCIEDWTPPLDLWRRPTTMGT